MKCAGIGNKHKDGNMQCGNCGYRPRNYLDEHFFRARSNFKFSHPNQDATEDLVLSVMFAFLILGIIVKVMFYATE